MTPKHRAVGFIFILTIFMLFSFFAKSLYRSPISVTADSLSPRAQEFIAQQSSDGTGLWSRVRLDATASSSSMNEAQISNPCFSLSLPWKISNFTLETLESSCIGRGKLSSPYAQIVFHVEETHDFAEDSSILLRKRENKKYTFIPITSDGFDEVVAFRSSDSFILFAKQETKMITIALTDLAQSSVVSIDDIEKLLQSVRFELPVSPSQ